jgi:hypothetical protein
LDRQDRRLYAASKAFARNHLRDEKSSTAEQQRNFLDNPSFMEKLDSRAASGSTGLQELIAQMTTWLDRRQAYLQQNNASFQTLTPNLRSRGNVGDNLYSL